MKRFIIFEPSHIIFHLCRANALRGNWHKPSLPNFGNADDEIVEIETRERFKELISSDPKWIENGHLYIYINSDNFDSKKRIEWYSTLSILGNLLFVDEGDDFPTYKTKKQVVEHVAFVLDKDVFCEIPDDAKSMVNTDNIPGQPAFVFKTEKDKLIWLTQLGCEMIFF